MLHGDDMESLSRGGRRHVMLIQGRFQGIYELYDSYMGALELCGGTIGPLSSLGFLVI